MDSLNLKEMSLDVRKLKRKDLDEIKSFAKKIKNWRRLSVLMILVCKMLLLSWNWDLSILDYFLHELSVYFSIIF